MIDATVYEDRFVRWLDNSPKRYDAWKVIERGAEMHATNDDVHAIHGMCLALSVMSGVPVSMVEQYVIDYADANIETCAEEPTMVRETIAVCGVYDPAFGVRDSIDSFDSTLEAMRYCEENELDWSGKSGTWDVINGELVMLVDGVKTYWIDWEED